MNLQDYISQVCGCEEKLMDLEPAFILTLLKEGEEND